MALVILLLVFGFMFFMLWLLNKDEISQATNTEKKEVKIEPPTQIISNKELKSQLLQCLSQMAEPISISQLLSLFSLNMTNQKASALMRICENEGLVNRIVKDNKALWLITEKGKEQLNNPTLPKKPSSTTTTPKSTTEPWTWTVYVHIAPNGRAYVGQTRQKPVERRWANGKGYKNNQEFWEDICYYGWENFQHIILRENIPTWESCQRSERYYIRKYNAFTEGYNRDKGGARKRKRNY